MGKIVINCLSLALLISVNLAAAQSIETGRGELSLTVPAGYEASTKEYIQRLFVPDQLNQC